jgi:methyl-accepting chemotaxis protein
VRHGRGDAHRHAVQTSAGAARPAVEGGRPSPGQARAPGTFLPPVPQDLVLTADHRDVSAISSRRISLRAKLLGGFGAVLLLMVISSLIGVSKTSVLGERTDDIADNVVPSVGLLGDLEADVTNLRLHQYRHVVADDASARAEQDQAMAKDRENLAKHTKLYEPMVADERDGAFLARFREQVATYERATAGFRASSLADRRTEAAGVLNAAKPEFEAIRKTVDGWMIHNDELAEAAKAAAHDAEGSAKTIAIVLLLLAIAVGSAIAVTLSRSIARVVGDVLDRLTMLKECCTTDLRTALHGLRDGDLTGRVTPVTPLIERWPNDELGDVAQAVNGIRENTVAAVLAFNESMDSLSGTVQEVSSSAGSVAAASQQMASTSEQTGRAVGEIASAVGDVALGAQRQVESLETTRQLTTEVVHATEASSAEATATAQAADEARRIAGEGEAAIVEATSAMAAVRAASSDATEAIRALGEKSSEIGSIVDTITSISEQTNLLALNAAIEAARAGEQGRGFAVVAEEVRKLAEESSAAASSISSLIRDIQNETARAVDVVEEGGRRTDSGAATVEQARAAFSAIGASVEDVTARIGRIAAAVEQVAASSSSISERVSDVAAVAEESSASTEQVSASTQETSAATQQIAASSQELAATAAQLEQLVSKFRTTTV